MIYFVSDVHLGFGDRNYDKIREKKFLQFLDFISKDCEILYLVGDIYDYWFEYDTVVPKYFYKTLTKFAELREKNIKIEYIMGNHDFGLKSFFSDEFGITVYRDDIERVHNNKRFFISHGDGKTTNDNGYKILKKILRAKISMKLFLVLHPDWGINAARGSSKKSRKYTDKKDFGKFEGMNEFAFSKIDGGFDYVIMGHRHKASDMGHKDGKYINLGEWFNNPHYAQFDGNELILKKWIGDEIR